MPTAREIFDDLGDRLDDDPAKLEGITARYQFNIIGDGGGTWHLVISNGKPEVGEGPIDNPDTTTTMNIDDYLAVATGQVSGRDMFFAGKMRVEGDPMLGMLLGRIMS